MKDSGIEWIGEIPEGWEVRRVKHLSSKIGSGKTPKGGATVYKNSGVLLLRSQNIHFEGLRLDDVAFIEEETDLEMIGSEVLPNDVLLNIIGASIGRTFFIPNNFPKANVNQNVCIIRPRKNFVHTNYLWMSLCSNIIQHTIGSTENRTAQECLNSEQIGNFSIILPPLPIQQAIASYLDQATARIDTLIAKKERQIELLQEKRQAIITHAVTKGLDPKSKMKDSGVEWIGEIPEGWEVRKLKYLTDINKYVLNENTNPFYEFKYIDIGSVESNGKINTLENYIFSEAPSRARRKLCKHDIIISTVRTYLKAISLIEYEEDLIASTGFAVLTTKNCTIPKILFYILSNQKIIDIICALSVGVSYPSISSSLLGSIEISRPVSIAEQQAIASYLDQATALNDSLIEKIKTSISLLREYRSSLITAAVTGQLQVTKEPQYV